VYLLVLPAFYIGETDDAPGAALIGILLMLVLVVFGARARLESHSEFIIMDSNLLIQGHFLGA